MKKLHVLIVLLSLMPLLSFASVDTIRVDTLADLEDFFDVLIELESPNLTNSDKEIPQRILEGYHQKAFDYVERFGLIAVAEQKKYGIPASITLAQGLLESGFGKSKMATTINNHFGIKCTPYQRKQKGKCYIFEDDTKYDRFVKFESAWASYRAHSLVLQNERYKDLYALSSTDYEGWALGLQKAGYASDDSYAKKLVRIIELYELYEFDE
jgi:flagellum-specific peptidoglycan hydrolase FlgJ